MPPFQVQAVLAKELKVHTFICSGVSEHLTHHETVDVENFHDSKHILDSSLTVIKK